MSRAELEIFICDGCDKEIDIDDTKAFLQFSSIYNDEIHFCSLKCAVRWVKDEYENGKHVLGFPR